MTKNSSRSVAVTDSETGSVTSNRANKLGAILCPAICALLLGSVFFVSFLGTKMAYEQYNNFCNSRYDIYRFKNFENITAKDRFVPYRLVVHAE